MRQRAYKHLGGDDPLIGLPVHAAVRRAARRFPHNEAVVSVPQGKRLTYERFFEEVERLARGLMGVGVGRGDRVGIWATDNVEWVALQIATARVGAILVNINPAYRTAELRHALVAARINFMFLMPAFRSSNYVEMMRELCPELERGPGAATSFAAMPELRLVAVYDPDREEGRRPAPGFMLWREVIEAGAAIEPEEVQAGAEKLEPDDPINIQFTSGTTGFPKPVVLTHHNITNNAWGVGAALALRETDRVCVPVPFYHCFGMVISNLACLLRGAAIVIPSEHFDSGAALAAVDEEKCTILHGVPTMFVAELEREDFDSYNLSTLRSGIMAGAPCPPELMRRVIDDMGVREILIAYGQTEASPATHITRRDDSFERRTETVGTNMPHQEVKITDPSSGRTLDVGQQGEVCFRGYHVMKGYFEMPEATAEVIDPDGWLHSGDLGEMDEDGYLKITGRLKEMVIRGGENIYPAEIEAYLATHPKVAQSAVFGVADECLGEDLSAWVQLHPGKTADLDEIRDFVRAGMAHFKVPRYVRLVDEFPMTVTGKIQKFKMRHMMEKGMAEDG